MSAPGHYPYLWRVRTRLADRFGQPCRVIARGAMNSALVEFTDGFQVVTSRNYFRKAPVAPWLEIMAGYRDGKLDL